MFVETQSTEIQEKIEMVNTDKQQQQIQESSSSQLKFIPSKKKSQTAQNLGTKNIRHTPQFQLSASSTLMEWY